MNFEIICAVIVALPFWFFQFLPTRKIVLITGAMIIAAMLGLIPFIFSGSDSMSSSMAGIEVFAALIYAFCILSAISGIILRLYGLRWKAAGASRKKIIGINIGSFIVFIVITILLSIMIFDKLMSGYFAGFR